jgi:S-formylglutathione hydrolase FrmB
MTVPVARVRVLLPARYDSTRTSGYPVLYLLHGGFASYRDWTDRTDVAELTRGLDLIVVMPDGGSDGWYSDWADGSSQWESYHTGVLVRFVDATFNTAGDGHRAVAGSSMGGFGAMKYAARHPGLFQAAAAFSGAVDMRYGAPATGPVYEALTVPDGVWGDPIAHEDTWRANNPADLAASLAGTTLLLATGNGVPGGHYTPDCEPFCTWIENLIWQMNLSFGRALDQATVPHTDLFYGPGEHDWPYWRDDLAWALPQLLSAIS